MKRNYKEKLEFLIEKSDLAGLFLQSMLSNPKFEMDKPSSLRDGVSAAYQLAEIYQRKREEDLDNFKRNNNKFDGPVWFKWLNYFITL